MKNLMEKVINSILDRNADGDLIFSSSKSLRMSAQKGEISTYNVSSTHVLGIRIVKNDKVGLSYTESLDDESLRMLVEQAMQNAETSEPNQHEKVLGLSGSLSDLAAYPEEKVEMSQKTLRTLELEEKVKALDKRVVAIPYNGYSEGEYQSYYLSSKGRSTSYSDKSYSINTSALLDDKGKKAVFYDFDVSHRFEDLQWNRVVENSLLHARNLLEEKALPTGKYSIRFSEDCLKSLVECFANFYSAKAAMDKINPWSERLGETVISKNLTVIDDPAYTRAFRATRFDAEGVESRPLTLIKDGQLQRFCHNSITASHFKTQTTGHAYRAPGGPMGISGTHFVLQGNNVKACPDRYLEVIQIDGLHSGANRVNGNFSVGIKGYMIENEQRTMAFGNITLSGNLIEILNRVDIIGSDPMPSTDKSFFSVPLIFHQMTVAGV